MKKAKISRHRDVKKEVAFCRKILRGYGITLRLTRFMPKYDRDFHDVHYNGISKILYQEIKFSSWLDSIWHEVGHAISADEQSRSGYNWCEPFPKWIEELDITECEKVHRLEVDASSATIAALIVFGADRNTVANVMIFTGLDYDPDYRQNPDFTDWLPEVRRVLVII